MGVEVVGFEMVEGPVETVTGGDKPVLHEKENGKLDQAPETIKFGSHGEELVKEEENGVSDSNFPRDAVDEWPAPKQIHSFYLIRYRPYDDPKIKAKIDQAAIEIEKRTQARLKITDALKAKRSDRSELIAQIKAFRDDNRQFKTIVDEKIKEIEPLQQVLGKLRSANSASRAGGLCSSEEELNGVIHSLQYRIQHESIPLSEEKQLLREIKQLESTREKVIANSASRAKIQESMVQKEALQDQVKLIGGDLDGVRKEQQAVRAKIKQLDDAVKAIDKDIAALQDELTAITEKREKARESIQHLRKQRDEGNSYFYQSRTLLNKARELAAKKDVKALEDLSYAEVEKFMALWNSDKALRDDYERRILPSLDSRQLSRDGRMRNPDEKPLVLLEEPARPQVETPAKALPKQVKEEAKSPQVDALPTKKVQKENKSKTADSKSTTEHIDVADKDIVFETLPKEAPVRQNEVDAAKLKEIKREEEMAKAKQAMERKKKLAEKAAAKAAIRAQKEAEKKNKEIFYFLCYCFREKKAKKKAAASTPDANVEEPEETVGETAEQPEKANENVEAPVAVKEKVPKESSTRSRYRTKGPESVPKALLKRKKTTNYWMWAAPAAVLAVALLVFLYYYQMRKKTLT
ncbi:proton pump-interactor 1 [Ziziphus jujuba]|uniref:Proton pump-interactor 1 n=1 Tax=Ziziphus jujuba TaxID=326968 RepID=A0ABM3ZWZ3_ZIZJJ|nr:proton pump-interactor 1 [Ziziphus jujuba]